MLVRRILSLAVLGAVLAVAPILSNLAAARTIRMPSLTGSWAIYRTGLAGPVARSGRLATMQIRRRGHSLTLALRNGNYTYLATDTYWPKLRVTFKWRMDRVGEVHFLGEVQDGGSRILGQWSDARGNDGGAYLTRIGRLIQYQGAGWQLPIVQHSGNGVSPNVRDAGYWGSRFLSQ